MTGQTATASVKVDGDKLAEAMRRVTPFMADGSPANLAGIYAEAQGGVLQLTTTDGFRMAHLTVPLPFPEGNWLMKAAGCKDFSQRHFNGGKVDVVASEGDDAGTLKLGEVVGDLETTPYIDYPSAMPEVFDTEDIIDTKAWIKPLRQHKPWILEEYRHGRPPLCALLCHDHSEESGESHSRPPLGGRVECKPGGPQGD